MPKKNIYVIKNRKTYDLGRFTIKAIDTYHDVENTSYLINFKPETLYYATDTRELPNDKCLKGLSLYCIEANYKEEVLEQHIQQAMQSEDNANKIYYLQRTKNTHLSQDKANKFLLDNMSDESEYVYLHQSKYNFEYEEE